MLQLRSLYDTLIGTTIRSNSVLKEVIEEGNVIEHGRRTLEISKKLDVVVILKSDVSEFNHPLFKVGQHKTIVYVDVRNYVAKQKVAKDLPLSETFQYPDLAGMHINYGILTGLWETGDNVLIASTFAQPAALFAKIVSQTLAMRLSVGPIDVNMINTLTSIMLYDTIFPDDKNDLKKFKFIDKTSTSTGREVKQLLEKVGKINTVEQLAKQISANTTNVSLSTVNPAIMIEALTKVFHAGNSAELLGISLEYPPAWWTLVHMVAVSKIYRNSLLGSVVYAKRKDYKDLDNYMKEIWENMKDDYPLNSL